MATTVRVYRDADNKWELFVDWDSFITQKNTDSGGTYTITGSAWAVSDPSIVEEAETPTTVTSDNKAFFVGSGGTNGVTYSIVNTITYSSSITGATNLTQDRTLNLILEDQ